MTITFKSKDKKTILIDCSQNFPRHFKELGGRWNSLQNVIVVDVKHTDKI